MSEIVMSDKYPQFCNEIAKMGHNVIFSDTIKIFHTPEQKHPDMQLLAIRDNLFMLNECSGLKEKLNSLGKKIICCDKTAEKCYPKNILLNCLYLNNTLYGKINKIDKTVLDYCNKNHIRTVNVNQGYTRCSTLVINQKAVITADNSIEKSLKKDGVEVLLVFPGNIVLDGFDYGFIGGAGAQIDNTIIFFGNIEKHPEYHRIKKFCLKNNSDIKILCPNMPLTDIGGIVRI